MTEIELHKILEKLLEENESEFLEFKLSQKVEFGQYISALSNGACLRNEDFGYLIFGVNDKNKKIIGTEIKKSDLDRVAIKKFISPKIDYSIHQFKYKNQSLLLVRIDAAKGEPTCYRNQPYARVGEDKTILGNLSTEQIKKIYNSTTDWSSQIVENATIDDLDPTAISRAREKFKEKAENSLYLKEVDNWSNSTFLDKADLTIKGKITNCALILVGKRESKNLLKDSHAAEITWELKDEKDELISYQRFYPPFLLSIEDVGKMIRNTKYLYPTNQLLNAELPRYSNQTIIEALNNCIAHQYYFSNDRGIILTEKPDRLVFENYGNFFEGKPEEYALGKIKAQKYRNQLLVSAMRHVGMIDKFGLGIGRMYKAQKERFFPMPDYTKSDSEKVILQIYGKIIDEKFSQTLMERDLDLTTVILLDHIQKNLPITNSGLKLLQKQKLVEGERGKYFISSGVAEIVGQKAQYIKNKAFDKAYYKRMILQFLDKYKEASRKEIDDLLMNKLSDILSDEQKKKKIEHLLQEMSKKDVAIRNVGNRSVPKWIKT